MQRDILICKNQVFDCFAIWLHCVKILVICICYLSRIHLRCSKIRATFFWKWWVNTMRLIICNKDKWIIKFRVETQWWVASLTFNSVLYFLHPIRLWKYRNNTIRLLGSIDCNNSNTCPNRMSPNVKLLRGQIR